MTAYQERCEREDEEDRLAGVRIRTELYALVIPERGAHSFAAPWKPCDKQGDVDPFDVQADWEEVA